MTHGANNQSVHDDCLFCMEHLHEVALGIAEPDDRPRLEHHLAECDICRAQLAEFDATVNLLPLAVPLAEPGPHVRASLRQRMETEMRVASPPSHGVPARSRSIRFPPSGMPWQWRGAPRSGTALRTVAVGLLVALLAIATWTFLPLGDNDDAPPGQMSVLAMDSPDTCEDCSDDTRGHIGADLAGNNGMVVAWNLDPDAKHEVWCVNKRGERLKVSDLTVDASGTVTQTVSFPEAVGDYDRIYVVRNDGTEELTVTPNKVDPGAVPAGSPPS